MNYGSLISNTANKSIPTISKNTKNSSKKVSFKLALIQGVYLYMKIIMKWLIKQLDFSFSKRFLLELSLE
jgi:hypothetical protein